MCYQFKSVDKQNGKLRIDSKGIQYGYFLAAVSEPTYKRLKLRVKKDNNVLTYDLKNNGTYELYSLQFGNGRYEINLFENVIDNKYSLIGKLYLDVTLKNKNSCFLVPNQYINYHEIPELIKLTKQLCNGKNKQENYNIIKKYFKTNFTYDYVKAVTVKKGALPDLKHTLQTHTGICYDLASLATAMLRIMGIPAKLVIGFADNRYHAWVEVIGSNKTIIYDPTFEIYNVRKVQKYIPERYY